MAAPYVAGQAALYKSEFPDASPDEVIANVTGSGSLPILFVTEEHMGISPVILIRLTNHYYLEKLYPNDNLSVGHYYN